MLLRITYPEIATSEYLPLLSPQLVEDLTGLAQEAQGLRFVHVNSTATGGGVAEILQSLVPLMNSLGVATERVVINPPPQFFQVTKRIHNLLQGAEGELSAEELDLYFSAIQDVAQDIQRRSLGADVWFLHDPQLLPLARLLPQGTGETRLWVCHIDLTNPNPSVMEQLLPLTDAYHGLVFSLDSYVPQGLSEGLPVRIAPPAIDPLTPKNRPLTSAEAAQIIGAMGIDPERPLVTQVSRFDYWKDPWGVVDAFRIARESIPGLQLALLGLSQAADDPEALDVLHQVTSHAADDPDIHLFFYPTGLPDTIDRIVNAFQVASDVVMQKSLREGFGLTVSEAMWKARPVIGGDVGGIRIQIQDGSNGYLVNSPQECARHIIALLRDPDLSRRIGDAGREKVRNDFLLPRLAYDYLKAAWDLGPGHSNRNGSNGHRANGFESLERLHQEAPAAGVRQPDPAPVRRQSRES